MLDIDKLVEVAIGLINFLLSTNIFILIPRSYKWHMIGGQAVLATASGLLIFGALGATKKHRVKIQNIWLQASVVFLAAIIFVLIDDYNTYTLLAYLAYAIPLMLMMIYIYRLIVKDPQEAEIANKPPPYDVKAMDIEQKLAESKQQEAPTKSPSDEALSNNMDIV